MLLIIGLGNPGKKYTRTRHNAGFFMLDKIQSVFSFPKFEFNKKFQAEISSGEIKNKKIILAKPRTFINLSGEAVRAISDFYKMTPEELLVIHDDIDIELGKIKVAADSSSAGHNGVENIIDVLGTQKFRRVRVGIGKTPEEKKSCLVDAHDYVLGELSREELEILEKISENVLEEVRKLLI